MKSKIAIALLLGWALTSFVVANLKNTTIQTHIFTADIYSEQCTIIRTRTDDNLLYIDIKPDNSNVCTVIVHQDR